MTIFKNILFSPDPNRIADLLARPALESAAAQREKTAAMLEAVRMEGDTAVRRFSKQFDGFESENHEVTEEEFGAAERSVALPLQAAIRQAYSNIRCFHERQQEVFQAVETMPGVCCWRESVPIGRVGLYVPGGTAPLFSTVLMLGVPAQIAGCREVVLCTPPRPDGSVHPAMLFAARLCGIRRVFKVGGVQAIGAMAYGTVTVPKVWKIFGPGNSWVTTAKQLVSLEGVAVDLPAGPSEVCVIADAAANPRFIAADLLSQAEHGADSQVVLISDSEPLIRQVEMELKVQLARLPRKILAEQALQNSTAVLVRDLEEALAVSNEYAPEHLILHVNEPERLVAGIANAGSVFLGGFTPESAGDYASGTNHTLPTGGHARAYAGVSLDSFTKKITFQRISEQGLAALGPSIIEMARAEGLEAHARAVEVRIDSNGNRS